MRQLFRVFSFLAVTAISFVVIIASVPQVANAADQLNWYSTDRDLVEEETISGNKRVILQSNFQYSGRYVTKWCIYLDGQALTGRSYEGDYDAPSPAASVPVYIYYERGVVSRYAGDQTSSGCWTTTLADRAYGFDVTLNTSTWSNGSHAVSIEATISDSSVITKTTTVTSSNTDSSVEWITTGPLNAARTMSLTAKITPRVNRIVKACLTRDGTAIQRSEQTSLVGDTYYNGYWGGPTGTFGSTTGGCVTFDSYQNSSAPSGLWQVTTLTISLNTSTWTTTPAELTLTITESIGRDFSAAITFNPASTATTTPATTPASPTTTPASPTTTTTPNTDSPTTNTTTTTPNSKTSTGTTGTTTTVPTSSFISWKFTGVSEGQILSGWTEIQPTFTHDFVGSGSIGLCITGITTGRSCGSSLVVNTSCHKNGPQVITATASSKNLTWTMDKSWEDSRKYNVSIDNPAPSLSSAKAANKSPSWKSSTTSGSITLNSRSGCAYSVTLKSSSAKAKTYKGLLDSDSTEVDFSGLKPKTKYTGVASITSENGTKKKSFAFTTPVIPPKPRPKYSGGSSGSSSGGGSYPRVVGWRLDRALSALGWSRSQASDYYCPRTFGILNLDNWYVVAQTSSTLYACKR